MKRIVFPTPAQTPVVLRDDLRADGSEHAVAILRCPTCAQLWPNEPDGKPHNGHAPDELAPHADRVGALMQRHIGCVAKDVSLESLAWWLLSRGLTSAPVVDEEGRLAGFVSMTDLVRALLADDLEPPTEGGEPQPRQPQGGFHEVTVPPATVSDIMTPVAIAVSEGDSLAEAASRMARHHVHQLAVVNAERHVVGLVSSLDLADWIANRPTHAH